jgi:hypothetical protein
MQRRSFLKNSIGALLFGLVGGNKIVNNLIESTKSSHDIILFLIQTKSGNWKIKGTKWIDVATSKISPFKYNLNTFKPLGVFDSSIAYNKKKQLWEEYDCNGKCEFVNYEMAYKRGLEAKSSGQLKSVCTSGGKVGGSRNRDNKHGLFSLTPEQKSTYGKLGATISYPKMLKWCEENNHWEKLAEVHRGVPKSKEQKEKISKKLKGRKLPKETCEKMSKSRTGLKHSQQTIKKLENAQQKKCAVISQFTLDGIWIKDWLGFKSPAEELFEWPNGRSIQMVCNYYRDKLTKGSKQSGGFIWKYKK